MYVRNLKIQFSDRLLQPKYISAESYSKSQEKSRLGKSRKKDFYIQFAFFVFYFLFVFVIF